MKRLFKILGLVLASALVQSSWATEIRCDGILANSGEDGEFIVKYEGLDYRHGGTGEGLAYDRLGALWAFGGTSNLTRLSLDGRMLASYPLDYKKNNRMSLVLVGDVLVIRIDKRLYRLPITAPNGTAPELMDLNVLEISLNAQSGKIGGVSEEGKVLRLDVASGQVEELGDIAAGDRALVVDLMADGRVVVDGTWAYLPGQDREEMSNPRRGSHQILGDYVYEFGWHMTVSRRNLDFEPEPGVVYGGSSGYFIGSLPVDGELTVPTGIAHLGGNRFAISGPVGVIHLVVFNAEKQTFEVQRRLGATHLPGAMVLDSRGRTWYYSGFWEWADGPDHILRGETSFASREVENMQGAVLPGGQLIFPYQFRGKPSMYHRPYNEDDKKNTSDVPDLPKQPTGLALYQEGQQQLALVVDRLGEGAIIDIATNGKVRKSEGTVVLNFSDPKVSVTSLGMTSDGKLLAANNGSVVIFTREGKTFKDVSNSNRWGNEEIMPFGSKIYLDVEGDPL